MTRLYAFWDTLCFFTRCFALFHMWVDVFDGPPVCVRCGSERT